jgi:3-isopropylmalate dehydrogenase
MMLEHLGESEAASLVEKGIVHAVSKMKSMVAGEMGLGTDAVGDLVAEFVAKS